MTWPSLTANLQCLWYSVVVLRGFNSRMSTGDAARSSCSLVLLRPLLQAAHCSGNVHTERYTVFFWRTVDFSRRRCRLRWRSSMLRTFRLGRPLWSCRRRGWSCVIWMNSKDEMMQGDPAIRTLDSYCLRRHPYSLRHLLTAYCLLPTHVVPYCIRM